MNYFSGVKTVFQCEGLDISVFQSYHVETLKSDICRNSLHVVSPASPTDLTMLKSTVRYLMLFGSHAWVFISALLLSYFTFARQSNMLCPSSSTCSWYLRYPALVGALWLNYVLLKQKTLMYLRLYMNSAHGPAFYLLVVEIHHCLPCATWQPGVLSGGQLGALNIQVREDA